MRTTLLDRVNDRPWRVVERSDDAVAIHAAEGDTMFWQGEIIVIPFTRERDVDDTILADAELIVEAVNAYEDLLASNLRLAQGLRVIRDSTAPGGYSANVATRALVEAGVPDPPEEDHL